MTKEEYMKICERAWDRLEEPRGMLVAVTEKKRYSIGLEGDWNILQLDQIMCLVNKEYMAQSKAQQANGA